MDANKYTRWAEYYDLDPRNLYTDDIAFYIERARRSGGRILELGCGTGRVALALARAGLAITGIDHSPAMLDILKRKRDTLSPLQQASVVIEQADMSSFELHQKFDLIIIPFRSFQALTQRSDQEHCLACVKRRLSPQGQFILDVFRLKKTLDQTWVRPRQEDWRTSDSNTGRTIARHSEHTAIDPDKQVLDVEMSFVVSDKTGQIDAFTDRLRLAYFHQAQLETLLESAGFQIVESLGYYDGTSIDQGSELIFICRHKS